MASVIMNNKELLSFNDSEIKAVFLLAISFSFILTFNMWGSEIFDFTQGMFNFLTVSLGMLIAVFLHELGHKVVAAKEGYESLIVANKAGILFSLFIVFYSRGLIPFITPNFLDTDARADKRIHRFARYDNPRQNTYIVVGGLLASVLMIAFFNILHEVTGFVLFKTMVLGVVLHAVYSLIPFEILSLLQLKILSSARKLRPSDGMHLLWDNFYFWLFALLFMIIYGLLSLLSGWVSLVLSLLLTIIVAYLYVRFMT